MTLNLDDIRWEGLFQPSNRSPEVTQFAKLHAGKSVLVTGAGGSIGSALARVVRGFNPLRLVLLDSSEQNLFRIDSQLSALATTDGHIPILGSVTDERCLRDIFERYQPRLIYHAGALKHVPLMERNPIAVVENNAFGTLTLAMMARRFQETRLIMISTDKAVNPHSIMGASKRLAELILLALSGDSTRMTSIRLGNVLGSDGSVVPLFLEQINRGVPVTVTDPEAERYFLTMDDTLNRIFSAAASCPANGSICTPAMGGPVKIVDLARYLIAQASVEGISINYTGLRPGDKLHEEFVSDRESVMAEGDGLRWIDSPCLPSTELIARLAELKAAVNDLNLAHVLDNLAVLVPEYQPSRFLLDQVTTAAT